MISSVTNNYVWAIKTDTQTVVIANTFANIIFTATPQINGWIYAGGTFTCIQTGIYRIVYTVIMSSIGESRIASVRGTLGGIEINGSAVTKNFQSPNQIWTNFFLANITLGQIFSLQFAGSSIGNETINFTPAIAGETPISASVTITRIA